MYIHTYVFSVDVNLMEAAAAVDLADQAKADATAVCASIRYKNLLLSFVGANVCYNKDNIKHTLYTIFFLMDRQFL